MNILYITIYNIFILHDRLEKLKRNSNIKCHSWSGPVQIIKHTTDVLHHNSTFIWVLLKKHFILLFLFKNTFVLKQARVSNMRWIMFICWCSVCKSVYICVIGAGIGTEPSRLLEFSHYGSCDGDDGSIWWRSEVPWQHDQRLAGHWPLPHEFTTQRHTLHQSFTDR